MLWVDVTLKDIETAKEMGGVGCYDKCPIAQALQRLGFINIDADPTRILMTELGRPSQRLYCSTPREVGIFIDDFDDYQVVKPFSFLLEGIRLAKLEEERKKYV